MTAARRRRRTAGERMGDGASRVAWDAVWITRPIVSDFVDEGA
jgi:hypothetical protein